MVCAVIIFNGPDLAGSDSSSDATQSFQFGDFTIASPRWPEVWGNAVSNGLTYIIRLYTIQELQCQVRCGEKAKLMVGVA